MHLQEHGFTVKATDVADISEVKNKHKIPGDLTSCHTAVVGGYLVEGHVPAADILRLLKERPKVAGLSVPGMPEGSPGMEGQKRDPYDVIAFGDGRTRVFSSYRP